MHGGIYSLYMVTKHSSRVLKEINKEIKRHLTKHIKTHLGKPIAIIKDGTPKQQKIIL